MLDRSRGQTPSTEAPFQRQSSAGGLRGALAGPTFSVFPSGARAPSSASRSFHRARKRRP